MRIRGIRNVNFSEKIANVLKNDSRTYVQEIEISTSSERESRFFLCSKQMDDKECGVALLFLLFTYFNFYFYRPSRFFKDELSLM